MLDIFCQVVITICGFTSLYLLASQDPKIRMYAGIVGLIGEPFWLTTTLINGQYGIVVLCFVYGVNWIRVVYSNWKVINESNSEEALGRV